MTEKQLLQALATDELDYPALAGKITASDTAHLQKIAKGNDVGLATKAVYLASLSGDSNAHDVVAEASRSKRELVRIAAASGVVNLPEARQNQVAQHLLDDTDPSVVKLTIKAVARPDQAVRQKLQKLGTSSPHDFIKKLSQDKLSRTP